MYQDIIKELFDGVDLISDEGIEADIRGFFREDETVKEYRIRVKQEGIYDIYILLKNPSDYLNEKKFFEFMQFMQHTKLNVFYKLIDSYGKKYVYLSASGNMRGFCCEIQFGEA